jgi:hypothetical protein
MSRAYVFSGHRPSQALMSIDSDHALPIAPSTASIAGSLVRSAISMAAAATSIVIRRRPGIESRAPRGAARSWPPPRFPTSRSP